MYRGNETKRVYNEDFDTIEYHYLDGTPVYMDLERPCGCCGKNRTKEGHDSCLGTLPFVMNACCGHGEKNMAYIQFSKNFIIGKRKAIVVQKILKILGGIIYGKNNTN